MFVIPFLASLLMCKMAIEVKEKYLRKKSDAILHKGMLGIWDNKHNLSATHIRLNEAVTVRKGLKYRPQVPTTS